jgi:ABC-2 type transport system ATP-binding protein
VGLDPAGRSSMLELISKIGSEFGISIVVASHLLGEIERICDHVVAVDSGKLLRADTISSMTEASQVLMIEVDEGAERLHAELSRRGLGPQHYERAVLVRLADESVYDVVRDVIADLGLPLNRLEQRRRHVEELFRDQPDDSGSQAPGSEPLEASHAG